MQLSTSTTQIESGFTNPTQQYLRIIGERKLKREIKSKCLLNSIGTSGAVVSSSYAENFVTKELHLVLEWVDKRRDLEVGEEIWKAKADGGGGGGAEREAAAWVRWPSDGWE